MPKENPNAKYKVKKLAAHNRKLKRIADRAPQPKIETVLGGDTNFLLVASTDGRVWRINCAGGAAELVRFAQ